MNSFILRTDDGDIIVSPIPLPMFRLHDCDTSELRNLLAKLPPNQNDVEALLLSTIALREYHDQVGSDAYTNEVQIKGTVAHALSEVYWWAMTDRPLQDADIALITKSHPRIASVLTAIIK